MTDTYKVNIACEMVMIFILVFLLASCLIRLKRNMTMKPLILLICVNLLLLFCQVAEWKLMIASGIQTDFLRFRNWKVLTYTLDYFLGYLSSLTFYHYVREHIRELYNNTEDIPRLNRRRGLFSRSVGVQSPTERKQFFELPLLVKSRALKQSETAVPSEIKSPVKNLLVLGIAAAAVYAFCMNQSWFYYLKPDGTETFNRSIYFVIFSIANLVTVYTVATLIKHRRILGKLNFWLFLFYKISPTFLLVADLVHGTCMTYLMRAFYTFILYVHVDLRNEQAATEKEARLVRQEAELTEMRTQIMLSQMQPHFLYNTFTTVSSLCYLEGAVQAQEVVDRFADYFRQNLDSMGRDQYISFEKELEHIKTYLWIEKIRFEDDLNMVYKINVTGFRLPSLSVQPLVENAVKHGICQKPGGGTVTIETQETEDEFLVIVSDDGAGFDPSEKPDDGKKHVGIENITQRLKMVCGGRLEVKSKKGEGTAAVVHLPKEGKYYEGNSCG